MSNGLCPEKALIFRIVHRDNIPWILKNGLHAPHSGVQAPSYIPIGSAELIEKRNSRTIPNAPDRTLCDYIPFYFTPYSPMMLNIKTGWGGIPKKRNEEIVILVSSLINLHEQGIPFLFTDRHAYLVAAEFFDDLANLDRIDWPLLQNRDFKRDPNDPEKVERYQAEALVYRHLPVNALIGMICYDEQTENNLKNLLNDNGMDLNLHKRPKWYF